MAQGSGLKAQGSALSRNTPLRPLALTGDMMLRWFGRFTEEVLHGGNR
jgi:hypothetical protein